MAILPGPRSGTQRDGRVRAGHQDRGWRRLRPRDLGRVGRGAPPGRHAGRPVAPGARPLPPPAGARPARSARRGSHPGVRARAGRRADRLTRRPAAMARQDADRLIRPDPGWPPRRLARRGQARLSPAGQGQPPGRRRRGRPAALPGHPGGLRPDRRPGRLGRPAAAAPGRDARGRPTPIGRDATHRAYGGRARRTRESDDRGGRARPGPRPRDRPRAARPARDRPPGRRAGRRGAAGSGRPPRPPKKATLGSTSYDGVEAEPFEPGLGRRVVVRHDLRHVLDAQPQGVRRPAQARPGVPGPGPSGGARRRRRRRGRAAAPDAERHRAPTGVDAPTGRAPGTTHPHDRDVVGGDRRRAPATRPRRRRGRRTAPHGAGRARATTTAAAPMPRPSARGPTRRRPAATCGWTSDDGPSLVGRVGRAVVGWAPIALGIGWLVGELSGCGRFAATCDPVGRADHASSPSWRVLAVLLLVPRAGPVGRRGRGRRRSPPPSPAPVLALDGRCRRTRPAAGPPWGAARHRLVASGWSRARPRGPPRPAGDRPVS